MIDHPRTAMFSDVERTSACSCTRPIPGHISIANTYLSLTNSLREGWNGSDGLDCTKLPPLVLISK